MARKNPPKPVHVFGTNRGEDLVRQRGREAGRQKEPGVPYRTARDSTSVRPRGPIDPRSPSLPPA